MPHLLLLTHADSIFHQEDSIKEKMKSYSCRLRVLFADLGILGITNYNNSKNEEEKKQSKETNLQHTNIQIYKYTNIQSY